MFLNGVVLDINRVELDRQEGPYRILSAAGKVIGIGNRGEENDLAVIQRFFGSEERRLSEESVQDGVRIVSDSKLKDINDLKGVRMV